MSDSYLFWLTLAVVLSAVALVAQAVCLYLIYSSVQRMQAKTQEFLPKAEAMLQQANQTLTDSRTEVKQITAKATQVVELAHVQMTRVDQFVGETTERARAQMDKVESLLDDSIGRTRHTVALLNDTATRPVRELNAVSAGLKAAFGAFFSRRAKTEPEGPEVNDEEPVAR